ncbi:MAG: DUF4177 domain-containing protein [Lawsonibacter sp.]|nr:DUF4177 domain-containing protein [Lawsonibacter sp.]
MMYTYEYERIQMHYGFGFAGAEVEVTGYREVIDRRAKEGWRYVGYLPAGQLRGSGYISQMDLIFEKEV